MPRLLSLTLSHPHRSKLDTDHLYMAYADIMAKVSEGGSGDAPAVGSHSQGGA